MIASVESDSPVSCRAAARGALREPVESCWPDDAPAEREPGVTVASERSADARDAMRRAVSLADAGELEDAVLWLRDVEAQAPGVADRIALRRGELLRALSMPVQACEAFAIAQRSPSGGVALRAQIGAVLCALEAADRQGEVLLRALLSQHPRLTQRPELDFALAIARERWGDRSGAAALLRQLDLDQPTSTVAARARRELVHLRRLGVHVEQHTWSERVARAERVVRSGTIDLALAAVEALRSDARPHPELMAQVEQLAARIARMQGHPPQPAQTAASMPGPDTALVAVSPGAAVRPAPTAERAALTAGLAALRGTQTNAQLKDAQVLQLFGLAAAARDAALCSEMLDAARMRRSIAPQQRFELAMRATGLADDGAMLSMLGTLLDAPGYQVPALYHHARTLERMGLRLDAEREYREVIASERQGLRYYSMWSDLRLRELREQRDASCVPLYDGRTLADAARKEACWSESTLAPSLSSTHTSRAAARIGRDRDGASDPNLADALTSPIAAALARTSADRSGTLMRGSVWELQADRVQRITAALERARANAGLVIGDADQLRAHSLALVTPLAETHGQAYPWLARARQLIELDRFDEASEELSETYMAWREAIGAPRMRSGIVPLWTGDTPPRRPLTAAERRARIALDVEARIRLGELATLLGDPAIAFDVGSAPETTPRAYAALVESAARRHHVDPDLLFATMRVESAFNARVQSGAGAVGLMQIMPRTGMRIAASLGVADFEPSQLLRPERNIEFSAWYLGSLLRRFEGRLPLAIASYNGGPHNVRRWLHDNSKDMPLDAFLERIPYKETKHYVRKVLSFYALYRAQRNLPAVQLDLSLPRLGPDDVAF